MTDAPRPELTLADLTEIGVERLKGVGDKKLKGLHKSDVRNLFDLITHYPRRYIDRTNERKIDELLVGEEANVFVRVVSTSSRRIKGGRTMVNIMVTDGTGQMELTFFNQAWRTRQLSEGSEAVVFGKVGDFRGKRQMANPVVDLVGNKTGKIIPVYPQSDKAGLTSWDYVQFLAEAVRRTLPPTGRGIVDPLPDWVLDRFDFVNRNAAIQGIHSPDSLEEAAAAKRRLIFEELFRMQLSLVLRKRALEATEQGLEHSVDGPLLQRFRGTLPFSLTGAQERAIGEIAGDLVRPTPMHRLLQGDVGSGKTLVAVASMLAAVDGGHQAALMAPTEVLAEQHHAGIRRLLDGLTVPEPGSLMGERPLKVELLSNRVSTPERKRILSELLLGTTDLIIGTHALIQDSVMFSSLGVVVIDEQHRFGVEQRAALRAKTATDALPDVLVMTATPIPRTAAMTVYGDLDVSVLDELPPGRTPIVTHWIPAPGSLEGEEVPLELEAMWHDVRASVAEGRQIYVVCPLIDESEKLEVASAETIAERLHLVELAGLSLGLLHGRQKSEDKDATMEAFRAGELDVLVATTVIEVGVDVPNATGMVILDADRFGIAQLHQLRGRVGRGQHASTCWLVGEPSTPDGEARLEALVASTDGFELAEVDLDLRGEGTILGERQKGQNDLKLASLKTDRAVVEAARHTAIELLDADPGLANHPGLATELELFLDPEEAEFLLKG